MDGPASTPPWDQEGTFTEARAQVRSRVAAQADGRGDVTVVWLRGVDAAGELEEISRAGVGVVVGSDLSLWRSPQAFLRPLSDILRELEGLLVFIEPTAGLGWRRAVQLLGRRFRRDIPAELRAAGFIVTTQVRLWDGLHGTYVRGEARHFSAATGDGPTSGR